MKEQNPWYKDKSYQGVAAMIIILIWMLLGEGSPDQALIEGSIDKILAAVAAAYTLFGRMFDRKKERE